MAAIRLEAPTDCETADRIVADAFGPGRFAKSAYRLREGVNAIGALSFVATVDGRVVGTVRYWPVDIGGVAALMLGPLAVERALQGQGIALALMQTSLDAARAQGHRIVVLVGDEPYYGRAGFKTIMPLGCVTMPGPVDPARLLGLALVEGAMAGLKGEMRKTRLDHPVSALGAALAPRVDGKT
jgi:predicted N-acetyltransferase YhbS